MAIFGRTRGVFSNMVEDIKKITFWAHILVQVIFFIFYGYSIYANFDKIIFLISYISLFIISFTAFIIYLINHNKHLKQSRKFGRLVRVTKYLANGTMVVFNVVEMLTYPISDFSKIILIVSGISLLVQIIIEFIRIFIEKYADMFSRSLELDLEFINKFNKLKEVKGTFFEVLDAPLEAIANKLENIEPEVSKLDKKLNKIGKEFNEDLKEKKFQKKLKKIQNKADIKKRSEENARQQKKEIVQHIKTIGKHMFKKKSNKDT